MEENDGEGAHKLKEEDRKVGKKDKEMRSESKGVDGGNVKKDDESKIRKVKEAKKECKKGKEMQRNEYKREKNIYMEEV